MNLNKLWVPDPKDGKPSVSLTLLLFSALMFFIANTLLMLGKVNTIGFILEFTYSCIALYAGRRFTFSGKQFSSDKAEEIENKIENKE